MQTFNIVPSNLSNNLHQERQITSNYVSLEVWGKAGKNSLLELFVDYVICVSDLAVIISSCCSLFAFFKLGWLTVTQRGGRKWRHMLVVLCF